MQIGQRYIIPDIEITCRLRCQFHSTQWYTKGIGPWFHYYFPDEGFSFENFDLLNHDFFSCKTYRRFHSFFIMFLHMFVLSKIARNCQTKRFGTCNSLKAHGTHAYIAKSGCD